MKSRRSGFDDQPMFLSRPACCLSTSGAGWHLSSNMQHAAFPFLPGLNMLLETSTFLQAQLCTALPMLFHLDGQHLLLYQSQFTHHLSQSTKETCPQFHCHHMSLSGTEESHRHGMDTWNIFNAMKLFWFCTMPCLQCSLVQSKQGQLFDI